MLVRFSAEVKLNFNLISNVGISVCIYVHGSWFMVHGSFRQQLRGAMNNRQSTMNKTVGSIPPKPMRMMTPAV
jgi:hypothetical protein